MMIQLEMGPGFDQARAELGSMGRHLLVAVSEGLEDAVGIAAATVQENYLTGQSLKTRTGLLKKTPKKGKFLTIPIGENLTGTGITRFSSPRQVEDGFFVKSKGRLFFGRKQGKRGKFRPLFVLVKSVFVQGSGALYDGVMDSLDDMSGAIEDQIAKKVGAN